MNLKLTLTLITIIFSLAIAIDVYQGFKADYEAVQSLERWMK